MNSEMYTAASGLLLESRRLEMTTHNLANVRTSGYRPTRAFGLAVEGSAGAPEPIATSNRSVAIAGTYEIPGPGMLEPTGNPLDLVLHDEGLLAVQTDRGVRFTRNGSLHVDPSGTLVDAQGFPVLDTRDAEIGGLSAEATISTDGRVLDRGAEVARLGVFRADRPLEREGNGLLNPARGAAPEPVTEPELRTGWLEGSGTDAVQELVRMIDTQRAFESYRRLITTTMNEINRRTVNEIAGR